MTTATLSQLIESVQEIDNDNAHGRNFKAQVSSAWMQGRAAFGGLITALAVTAMQKTLSSPVPLRAIQVLFSGPAAEGTVSITTHIFRQGRNVTTMRADVSQEGKICCSVMASFGAARESILAVPDNSRPDATPPESVAPLPFIDGLMPDFLQNFEVRWAKGSPPYSNTQDTSNGIWARFKETGTASTAHLIAIADIPPPIPLSMLSEPANGSSLTWALEFYGDNWEAAMEGWWYIETHVEQCSEGYLQQSYKIWAPNGQALAVGQQVMTVFA